MASVCKSQELPLTCIPLTRCISQYPTDFYIEVFSSNAARLILTRNATHLLDNGTTDNLSTKTRRRYARIRLLDTGVREPSKPAVITDPTPFIVILEPLYFGFLPASVSPVLLFMTPICCFSLLLIIPRVHGHLSQVANEVRVEHKRYLSAKKQE